MLMNHRRNNTLKSFACNARVLHVMQVSDIGLSFDGISLLPFLLTSMTLATFQMNGIVQLSKEYFFTLFRFVMDDSPMLWSLW